MRALVWLFLGMLIGAGIYHWYHENRPSRTEEVAGEVEKEMRDVAGGLENLVEETAEKIDRGMRT